MLGFEHGYRRLPFHAAGVASGFLGQYRRPRAIAKQAGADQHAGIVIEIGCRAAHFDADGQNPPGPSPSQQGFSHTPVGHRGAATLPDEIERKHAQPQPKALGDVAGQSRAQIAGAGADDEGVDVTGFAARAGQGALCRLRGEGRGVAREPGVQGVGVQVESFGEWVEGEAARRDTIRAEQNLA